MQDLSVTLVQAALAWEDPSANRRRIGELIGDLGVTTDLVVLPEMFTTGFTMDPASNAETMEGASVAWLADTARRHGVTLCGSLVIAEGGRFYNRLVWMSPDGERRHYDKRHLFRMAGEHRHYTAGTRRELMRLKGWRVYPLICYDLRFPVWSRGADAFDLQIFVANWPAARRSAWRALLPARAVENQCYCVGVNRVGTDGNGIAYAGDSLVADYLGNVTGDLGAGECVITVMLDAAGLVRYREKFPAWQDADAFRLDRDIPDFPIEKSGMSP
jgi:predicted amidohydrolase